MTFHFVFELQSFTAAYLHCVFPLPLLVFECFFGIAHGTEFLFQVTYQIRITKSIVLESQAYLETRASVLESRILDFHMYACDFHYRKLSHP